MAIDVSLDQPLLSITLPWKALPVIDGDRHWVAIVDPDKNEICRLHLVPDDPESVATVDAYVRMLTATPWLMLASKRTADDLARMAELKNGVTVRQWVRNHEGARRKAELDDACERAWKGKRGTPPSSYGVK